MTLLELTRSFLLGLLLFLLFLLALVHFAGPAQADGEVPIPMLPQQLGIDDIGKPPAKQTAHEILMLPPKEFDHEYSGKMHLNRVTLDGIRKQCPRMQVRPGYIRPGCAVLYGGDACVVYIVDDDVLKSIGWEYDLIYRHERAHCKEA
jgi:hypothetical protein